MKTASLLALLLMMIACSQSTTTSADTAEVAADITGSPEAVDVQPEAAAETIPEEITPETTTETTQELQQTALKVSCEAAGDQPAGSGIWITCDDEVINDDMVMVAMEVSPVEQVIGISFHLEYDPEALELVHALSPLSGLTSGGTWKFLFRSDPGRVVGAAAVYDANKNPVIPTASFGALPEGKQFVSMVFKVLKPGATKLTCDFRDTAVMKAGPSFLPISKLGTTLTIEEVPHE